MPTKRTRRTRQRTANDLELAEVHLRYGTCLLAHPGLGCACGLVDGAGVLQEAIAAAMWHEHRAEILSEWKGAEPAWGSRFDKADGASD